MNADTLDKLNDQELAQLIAAAQGLQQARAEKRKIDAMEQIRRIASTAQIIVTFDAARKSRRRTTILRAGDRYVNPGDPSQSYVVGKGKQPNWFLALREKGRLPPPVASDLLKPKES
jgi:hypothetical protein